MKRHACRKSMPHSFHIGRTEIAAIAWVLPMLRVRWLGLWPLAGCPDVEFVARSVNGLRAAGLHMKSTHAPLCRFCWALLPHSRPLSLGDVDDLFVSWSKREQACIGIQVCRWVWSATSQVVSSGGCYVPRWAKPPSQELTEMY